MTFQGFHGSPELSWFFRSAVAFQSFHAWSVVALQAHHGFSWFFRAGMALQSFHVFHNVYGSPDLSWVFKTFVAL